MIQQNSNYDKFLNVSYFKLLIVTMTDTVKIDNDLLERIRRLIRRKDKRIKYANRKQFVNVAGLELLEKEENGK